jgi:hypothetical protein
MDGSIEKEVSYYEEIRKAIREYSFKTGGHEPSLIIVHPNTWDDLCDELLQRGPYFHKHISQVKGNNFNGYPVYRSYDVPEGDFVIY